MKHILPISIIIPTINRPNTLLETLMSFLNCEFCVDEIIIVDQSDRELFKETESNISKIGSCQTNIKHLFSDVQSSAASRNTGLRNANNDIVVFSDDDVTLVDSTIFKSIFDLMSNDNISLIAGLDVNAKKGRPIYKKFLSSLFLIAPFSDSKSYLSLGLFGRLPSKMKTQQVCTSWAMGYFFVIKKSIALSNNIYFDENLKKYAYAEDLDFSYRYCMVLRKNNLLSIVDKNVIVSHNVSNEFRFNGIETLSKVFINREYLRYKWHKNNVISKVLMWWSNLGYRLSVLHLYGFKKVSKAYSIYRKNKHLIKEGLIDQISYL